MLVKYRTLQPNDDRQLHARDCIDRRSTRKTRAVRLQLFVSHADANSDAHAQPLTRCVRRLRIVVFWLFAARPNCGREQCDSYS